MADEPHVDMVQACVPNLTRNQFVATLIKGDGVTTTSVHGPRRCPSHDDVDSYLTGNPAGECLDSYWSQRYLAGLSLRKAWRLWRSWRKQGGR